MQEGRGREVREAEENERYCRRRKRGRGRGQKEGHLYTLKLRPWSD